ncbi:hypothetical protein [Ralstonia syzygii]|uniref:hypothetical protein n=1 Tax=Ralstonia syzygii TaxID=28097 RepID=UPI0018D15F51|nr:hypothetical protein [Ralstonia syzygii]
MLTIHQTISTLRHPLFFNKSHHGSGIHKLESISKFYKMIMEVTTNALRLFLEAAQMTGCGFDKLSVGGLGPSERLRIGVMRGLS